LLPDSSYKKTHAITKQPRTTDAALLIVKRRAKGAGLPEEIGRHTLRTTGITAFLASGGDLATAQKIAARESPRIQANMTGPRMNSASTRSRGSSSENHGAVSE
jgi:hypothetical protein